MLQILDKDKSYLLGFFHADGSFGVNRKKYRVNGEEKVCESKYFHIGSTDKEVMEFISSVLRIPLIVSVDKRKENYLPYYRINSHNREIVDDLEFHGYCERKHEGIQHFPRIPDKYFPDFLRGFLDGDGCVSVATKLIRFYITEEITLEAISGYLDRMQIKYYVYRQPRKTMCLIELRIARSSVVDFYHLIYNGGFKLNRKYEAYTEVVRGIVSARGNMGKTRMK